MSIRSKVTTGVVGLIVFGVGAWSAALIPTPLSTEVSPLTSTVTPDGVNRHLVCAGAVAGHIADSADITAVDRVSLSTVAGERESSMELAGSENGAVIARSGDSPVLAATESASASDTQFVGYLATECGDALNDQWLIGGSTETGRESTLMLSNGADVDARVDIDIWGTNGLVDALGSKGIVVPAHSQRAYSVAGFIPDEASPAVHVISTGAAIWATLQISAVRGLVPGGLDRIGSVAEPTTTLAFPSVSLPAEETIGEVLADPDYSDVPAAIRLLNPGDIDATATIQLIPAGGGDAQSVTATVTAGVVSDIALSDFESGDWSIVVTSDQPIVGAIRTGFHDPTSGVTDLAWESASPIHTGSMAIAVPETGTLGIVNAGTEEVSVDIDTAGSVTTVTIGSGETVIRSVSAGDLTLTSDGDIAASIALQTSSGIATLRALPEPHDAGNVAVIFG